MSKNCFKPMEYKELKPTNAVNDFVRFLAKTGNKAAQAAVVYTLYDHLVSMTNDLAEELDDDRGIGDTDYE